jgi:carbon-monoxide dehydrogenase medium subunit
MTLWQEFRQPTTLSEAIEDLQNAPPPVIPIAGGTDLLLDIKQGRHSPVHTLIDLTGVSEMNVIEIRDAELFIGASVPVNRITENPDVNQHAQALVEACNLIAGPQVRNTATLGGNAAHALPAADGTIALVALNAQAEIVNPEGKRRIPFVELFLGPGKSSIDKSSELIAGFYLPLTSQNQASCFKRIMRPQGVALPILNCAVWIDREQNFIEETRISIGPGGPKPFRATEAETALRGQTLSSENLDKAVESLLKQATFRTSPQRATADYRKYIIVGLFKDTFTQAWQRAA